MRDGETQERKRAGKEPIYFLVASISLQMPVQEDGCSETDALCRRHDIPIGAKAVIRMMEVIILGPAA
jgi:hypothetical protein